MKNPDPLTALVEIGVKKTQKIPAKGDTLEENSSDLLWRPNIGTVRKNYL
jgi:hypothetical protein